MYHTELGKMSKKSTLYIHEQVWPPGEKKPGETWSLLDPEEVRDSKSWINWNNSPKIGGLGSGFPSLQEKGHLFWGGGVLFGARWSLYKHFVKRNCCTLKNRPVVATQTILEFSTPKPGEDEPILTNIFSQGLKPPTREEWKRKSRSTPVSMLTKQSPPRQNARRAVWDGEGMSWGNSHRVIEVMDGW